MRNMYCPHKEVGEEKELLAREFIMDKLVLNRSPGLLILLYITTSYKKIKHEKRDTSTVVVYWGYFKNIINLFRMYI